MPFPGRGRTSTVLLPSAGITTMPFEAPYQTPVFQFGTEGLNLRDPSDRLTSQEMSRANNIDVRANGEVVSRWGQHEFATSGGTKVHSGRELRDPRGNTITRIWGIDTSLFIGGSGALSSIDSGYSGDPLTLVPLRPDHGGASWMYVADRNRMRKVRNDGLDLPIGLPKAADPTSALLAPEQTTIADFEATDGTEAGAWGPTTFLGTLEDWIAETTVDTDAKVGAEAVRFAIRWSNSMVPADNRDPIAFFPLERTMDLSMVGAREASDSDLFTMWMKLNFTIGNVLRRDEPELIGEQIEEMRLYFVTGDPGSFVPTVLPASTENSVDNRNAYVKSIRQNELTTMFTGHRSLAFAQGDEATVLSPIDFVERTARSRDSSSVASATSGGTDPPPLSPLEMTMGMNEWKQLGAKGRPFRRGQFYAIGDPDWSKVVGIIVYMKLHTRGGGRLSMSLDDWQFTGGYGPDTSEPEAIPYDVRVTDFDTRTGTESNPSDEQEDDEPPRLEPQRQGIVVTPVAKGDAAFRQRIYVRGGFNIVDWFRAGVNDADGDPFTIEEDDILLRAKDTVQLDHDEPVTTTDEDGEALLAQPLRVIFPLGDLLVGLGDIIRPGYIYWCRTGEFGHWPPQNNDEVCPPGEELMSGIPYGGQAFVFSRKRMFIAYQNLTASGSVITTNTACHRGLHSPWALAVGERGVYAVDTDGIYVTTGGAPTEIAEKLYSLFHREDRNGYRPINMSQSEEMRLVAMDGRIFFQYEDYDGDSHVAVFDERRNIWIGIWTFGREVGTIWVENDESITPNLVRFRMGGKTTGDGYALSDAAFSDDGVAIAGLVRTGMWNGNLQRENKQLGDAIIDVDASLTAITVQFLVDLERVTNAAQTVPATEDGRRPYILDAFGTTPQQAITASLEVSWSSLNRRPRLYEWGIAFIPIPEETNRRATQWDDMGSANEKYSTGVMIECDTFNVLKSFTIEYDLAGTILAVQNVSPASNVTANGRHRFFFSWPRVKANLVRLRPSDECVPWILYKLEWSADPEPPRIADWDSNYEEAFDSYYTGLDIVCDTFGVEKQIELYVDGARLTHPNTGETFWRVTTIGKQVAHLSTTPAYGHIFRYVAIDNNPGLDYGHRWFQQQQPSEQTNWNQGFSVGGTRADKWMKGVVLEIDTFGVQKAVRVEVDGGLVETFNVTENGRRVIQHAFAAQVRGRVMRVFSIDSVAARLWPPPQIIFDEEPLALQRWETQEITHGMDGWMIPVEAKLCYRSTAAVTIVVTSTIGDDGTTVVDTYTDALPSTADAKHKIPFFFRARKGLLFKYVLTSSADFYLYREESEVHIQPWGVADRRPITKPFGNDDMDAGRSMVAKGTPDSDVPGREPSVPSIPQSQ